MAKTTTAKRSFKIVDLVRKRDSFKYIEVPRFPVEVVIEVTTSSRLTTPKPAPSSVFDRLEEVAREKLEDYEKIITEELNRIEGKIEKLMEQPGAEALDEAEKMTEATTASVKKALASAEGAAEQAVEERLKKEARGDDLLTEARVKTGVKVVTGVISVGANVAKLVVTMGADVTSYLSIAKTLFSLGTELNQQLKGEETLRKDLKAGVDAFLDIRSSTIMQALTRQHLTNTGSIPKNPRQAIQFIAAGVSEAGEEISKGRDARAIAGEVMDFVVKGVKGKLKDAESARVVYRNHTTKMRQKVDAVAAKADELMKAMKAARTLREGVEIGAECMKLKGTVRGLAGGLSNAEGFLDEMQEIMKDGGLDCDDTTVIQKLQKFSMSTIASEGASLISNIKTVYSLVSNVAEAVA
jgi:hypothetical protein